jgi:phosphatidate cytidylyltransferase
LFWVVVVVAACVALFEYFRMACPELTRPRQVLAIIASLLPVLTAAAGRHDLILAAMIASLLAVAVIALRGYGTMDDVHRFMSCGGFATLYVSLISPKKTVAGGIGGLLAGIVAALVLHQFFPVPVNPLALLAAAALLVVVGIAGDLTESMIKRSVGVKDSGTILAGHGGILDRIDSLLLTAPVLYYLLHFGLLG